MKYSDKEILEAINTGNDSHVLNCLYSELFPKVKSMIMKNNGDEDEAADIFQDSVIVLYKQVKMAKFKEEYEIGAFVYTVCRNLWINRVKRKNRSVTITDREMNLKLEDNVLDSLISEEREKLVLELFSKIGERCKELLIYSIFNKYSMKEICEKMGFSTENAAKTRNYKCKQKLIKLVEENESIKKFLRG